MFMDSFSVHHQESSTVHTNRYMPYRLCWLLASFLAAERLLSQGELCFMEWVILTASLCYHMLMFEDAGFCEVLDFVFGREYIVVLRLHFGFLLLHLSYFLLFRIWIPFYGLVLALLFAVLQIFFPSYAIR